MLSHIIFLVYAIVYSLNSTCAEQSNQFKSDTSDALATKLLTQANLQDNYSGAALLTIDDSIAYIAVGEGMPQDGTVGSDAEWTAKFAAFIVAKGELIRILQHTEIKSQIEIINKIKNVQINNVLSTEEEHSITETFNSHCEGVLREIITISSTYDSLDKFARVVIISIPEARKTFDCFGPGVRVVSSIEEAMDEITSSLGRGTEQPLGVQIVVVRNDNVDKNWLLAWGSDSSRNITIRRRMATINAISSLNNFTSESKIILDENLYSAFTKKTTRINDLSDVFSPKGNWTSLQEKTELNSTVKATAIAFGTTIGGDPREVENLGLTVAFAGFEYVISDLQSSEPTVQPAIFAGFCPDKIDAMCKATQWSPELPGLGVARSYAIKGDYPSGVGVVVALHPSDSWVTDKFLETLKMKCHAAAVRGLAIAMGLENKMYVEAHIIKIVSDQLSYNVEESENTIRITMCISESEVQRIRTFGNVISNKPK